MYEKSIYELGEKEKTNETQRSRKVKHIKSKKEKPTSTEENG